MKAPRVIVITVTPHGNGWAVTTDPDSAEVYTDETIVWDVTAPPNVSVEVTNFAWTASAPPAPFSGALAKSGKTIKAKVRGAGFAPVYKYEIEIREPNGTWYVDPDIQIKEH